MEETQNPQTTLPESESKSDIDHFNYTLISAIVVMLVVVIAISVLPFWKNANIVFVTPLNIQNVVSDCPVPLPTEENPQTTLVRCYDIGSALDAGAEKQPHPISIIGLIKLVMSVLVLYLTARNYMGLAFTSGKSDVSNPTLDKIAIILRNILLGLALSLFTITAFSALEVMAGLAAIDSSPLFIRYGIAMLTVSVFISVVTFLLTEWLRDMSIVDIGRAGILILMISYSLSIPFSTHNWNEAYSALGSTNDSAIIAGGNGSEMLFTFTMFALGMIFIAFTIDILRLFVARFSDASDELSGKTGVRFIIGLCGIIAGVGSMFVGYFPTNDMPTPHIAGVIMAVGSSVILVAMLIKMYPEAPDNPSNKQNLYKTLWRTSVLGIIMIVFIEIVAQETPGWLELEFAYFFLFLLFIQIYSTHLREYIEAAPGIQQIKDFSAYRHYPAPAQFIDKIGQSRSKG